MTNDFSCPKLLREKSASKRWYASTLRWVTVGGRLRGGCTMCNSKAVSGCSTRPAGNSSIGGGVGSNHTCPCTNRTTRSLRRVAVSFQCIILCQSRACKRENVVVCMTNNNLGKCARHLQGKRVKKHSAVWIVLPARDASTRHHELFQVKGCVLHLHLAAAREAETDAPDLLMTHNKTLWCFFVLLWCRVGLWPESELETVHSRSSRAAWLRPTSQA
jgi:hypothetical protein